MPNGGSTYWTFSPFRTDELDAINELNKWTGTCGTILSTKQLLMKNGQKIFAWAVDRFKNLLKNWEWIRIHVEGQIRFEYAKWEGGTIFESAKKDMRIQKYPDTCERGWAWVFLIAPPFFLFGITDAYVLRSFVIVHEQSLVKHIFCKVE